MHPTGTPKYNMMQKTALGVKRNSPNMRKKRSAKGLKPRAPRAQWNLGPEKSLLEILHDHNNEYYRAQNGWSGDTWNQMAKIFQDRNKHVNFTKSQLQDKEKELKREYKMLKDARMQSGAGWCEQSCRIQADAELWANLVISFPKIGKFKRSPFPLFDSLGDLYDGQIAEGTYNFTSSCEPSHMGGEFEDEREAEEIQNEHEYDDEIQVLDDMAPGQRRDEASSINQVSSGERVDNEQRNEKNATTGPKKKPPKELKKPNKRDEMVGVVDRYVTMKEKQAEEEKAESNFYSIGKCISALHKMKDFSREERVKASKVFKVAENREIFLTWAAEDEESAIMWLRGELHEIP